MKLLRFWYGFQKGLPACAYHPSIMDRSLQAEVAHLLKTYPATNKSMRGISIPVESQATCRIAKSLKVFAKWMDGTAFFQIHQVNYKGQPFPLGVGGITESDRDFFLQFAQGVSKQGGLSVTVCDDDMSQRWDLVNLLVEQFKFEVPKQ